MDNTENKKNLLDKIMTLVKSSAKIKIGLFVVGGIVILAGVGFGIMKLQEPAEEKEELTIDNTTNVVTEIKKISEFTSACYYEELILVNKISEANKTVKGFSEALSNMSIFKEERELVMIAKGKVRAGFDLSELKENDIQVKTDTLIINLPTAKIFDVIINPSGFETFIEEGEWSQKEVTAIQMDAKEKLKQNAIADGLIEKATNYGQDKLTALFKTFGFNEVIINKD